MSTSENVCIEKARNNNHCGLGGLMFSSVSDDAKCHYTTGNYDADGRAHGGVLLGGDIDGRGLFHALAFRIF